MRYITPLAEVTWEVWNRDNTFDAIYILYDVVPLRFHKGHHVEQNLQNYPQGRFFVSVKCAVDGWFQISRRHISSRREKAIFGTATEYSHLLSLGMFVIN